MRKSTRHKNFFSSLVAVIFLWSLWIVLFFFVPPEAFLVPFLFLFVTFLTIFLTTALLLAHTRRGLLIGVGVLLLMILNHYHIGNYLNIVLITGVLLTAEFHFSTQND